MSNKLPPPPTPPPTRKFHNGYEICNSNCKRIVDGKYQTMCDVCSRRGLPKNDKIYRQEYGLRVVSVLFGVALGSFITTFITTM